jgi:diguanylate cyclase (GGDEF)-like protein
MDELVVYHNIQDKNILKILERVYGYFEYLPDDELIKLSDSFIVFYFNGNPEMIENILSHNNNVMILAKKTDLDYFFDLSTAFRFHFQIVNNFDERLFSIGLQAYINETYKIFELKKQITEMEEKIFDLAFATTDVLEQKEKMESLATKDGMTRLFNHASFREILQNEFESAKKSNEIFSLAMLDIDYFKTVNDRYGHLKGDEVLRAFAQCILTTLSPIMDIPSRYGGEEFAIIFRDQKAEHATQKIEKIRKNTADMHFEYEGSCFKITFSAGITEFTPLFKDSNEMLKYADEALYQSKITGRDRNTIKLKVL